MEVIAEVKKSDDEHLRKLLEISYASPSTESRYGRIEKELLVIVYVCPKFVTYVYGRLVVADSDHRSLQIPH